MGTLNSKEGELRMPGRSNGTAKKIYLDLRCYRENNGDISSPKLERKNKKRT